MIPKIVAELGASHLGYVSRAAAIVQSAAKAGADAIKLQTYTPDSMVADRSYVIPSGPWAGRNLYQLYQESALPLEWHATLFQAARDNGIECFSTPFSEQDVEFLEHLECPRYKIASFELTDLPLIRAVASTRKPIILSTGMASYVEIDEAVALVREYHDDVTLLKCTSAYPAEPKDANLLTMVDMLTKFHCNVGVSDHTKGIGVPVAAAMLGASMIEKHIQLDNIDGPDHHFALTPEQFRYMVTAVREAVESSGDVKYGPTAAEASSLHLRRSVYALRDIPAGHVITKEDVGLRRPAMGASPAELRFYIGHRADHHISAGTPL